MDLKGKAAIVTGGTGGIGQAVVTKFLEEGAKVCIADLFEDKGAEVVKELGEKFGPSNVIFVKCDVTKDQDFEKAFEECRTKLGPVYVLVNNAGIVDEGQWEKTININLIGTIRGCELALKNMGKHNGGQGGHVVNLGSGSGLSPYVASSSYSASKGGVVMYTRSAGLDFHYEYTGVTFKCICPTLVDTPILEEGVKKAPNKKIFDFLMQFKDFPRLKPSEVAEAILKLMNEGKSGSVMVISSGMKPIYVDPPEVQTLKP